MSKKQENMKPNQNPYLEEPKTFDPTTKDTKKGGGGSDVDKK